MVRVFGEKLPPVVSLKGAVGHQLGACLLYTSDAADDLLCVDLGGRRIIKKKKTATDDGKDDTINKQIRTTHTARPNTVRSNDT